MAGRESYAFVFLSTHCHLLLRPKDALELSDFMGYLNSNIAREAGRLHRWREKFWGLRYRPVPVSFEPEAQIGRLRYLLSHGCKEGLVDQPQDWPGPSSIHALLGDGIVTGTWHDRTAEYWARKTGEAMDPARFVTTESLTLRPLPCWDDLPAEEVRVLIAEITTSIVAETRQQLRNAKKRPMGVRRILRQNPHSRPQRVAHSAAPRFHAATWQIRKMLDAMYRSYRDAYRDAMEAMGDHTLPVRFPNHGIPPPALRAALPA